MILSPRLWKCLEYFLVQFDTCFIMRDEQKCKVCNYYVCF